MASTVVGKSGRVYTQSGILQRRHDPHRDLNIYKAESGNDSFVYKRVPRPFFELAERIATEFAGSRRLRLHVDSNQEEGILIYPYFQETLLALIPNNADLLDVERKKIIRCVGEALQEFHDRGWIHIDVKPDNILINWTCDNEGKKKIITDVTLGDFDIAFKPKNGEPLTTRHAIGNAMWRSPEGQTGHGVTQASDVFSFGLVCIYAFGGGDFLVLSDESFEAIKEGNVSPEQEIVTRHFVYFGPATEGLLRRVNDEIWCTALKDSSAQAEVVRKERPDDCLDSWGKDLGPSLLDMISGMVNMDPTARMTMKQVMAHPWWQEPVN